MGNVPGVFPSSRMVSPFSLPSCRSAEVIEAIGFGVPQALAACVVSSWGGVRPGSTTHFWRELGDDGGWVAWLGSPPSSPLVIRPVDNDGHALADRDSESDRCSQIVAMVLCGFVWAADGAELLLLGCLAEPPYQDGLLGGMDRVYLLELTLLFQIYLDLIDLSSASTATY